MLGTTAEVAGIVQQGLDVDIVPQLLCQHLYTQQIMLAQQNNIDIVPFLCTPHPLHPEKKSIKTVTMSVTVVLKEPFKDTSVCLFQVRLPLTSDSWTETVTVQSKAGQRDSYCTIKSWTERQLLYKQQLDRETVTVHVTAGQRDSYCTCDS